MGTDYRDWHSSDYEKTIYELKEAHEEEIKQLQAELEKYRWIPVSEGLPEELKSGIPYLVLDDEETVVIDELEQVNKKLKAELDYWKLKHSNKITGYLCGGCSTEIKDELSGCGQIFCNKCLIKIEQALNMKGDKT